MVGRVFRFQAQAALSDTPVNANDLLNLMVMATTATTSGRLIETIRIRKIEMWAPMASDLIPVTASVEFTTSAALQIGAKRELHSDTSMGAMRCAYVAAKPSPLSAAGQWVPSDGNTWEYMLLNCPDNTIIDLHVTMVLKNTEATSTGTAPTGATAGRVYYGCLTGSSSETVPVSATVIPGV